MLLLNPEVAQRSCEDCQTYLYMDRGSGQFGERVMRGGKPVLRAKNTKPPCHWCPKIAPNDEPIPANAHEMTEKSQLAYQHYLECKAVGQFPADTICRRNAALCASVEAAQERIERARGGLMTLGSLLKGM